ncbi:MAG: hypothetical protein SGI96_05295 [Bacteroidota bacterium]|nr:hypothetical protein [Chitinophagaceae bacterium]MDZ4807667.1 hypothetical protein [Bacteroidota bacterium]
MKRMLQILSLIFLGLWVAGLFYLNGTSTIHIALIVGLIFFFRSLMIIETPAIKETGNTTTE